MAHMWNAPPVVVRYLKTGDESIREIATNIAANRSIYVSAARNAAEEAANEYGGHHGAAWNAAWATTEDLHPWGSAWDAERVRQGHRLAKLLVAGRRIYGQRQMP